MKNWKMGLLVLTFLAAVAVCYWAWTEFDFVSPPGVFGH
jgi:hypothetical protein